MPLRWCNARLSLQRAGLSALPVLAFGALLAGACGYEIQLTPAATATPGPLNVHVVGGLSGTATPTPGPEVAALLRQALGTPVAGRFAPAAPAAGAFATPSPAATPSAPVVSGAAAAPARYDASVAGAEPPATSPAASFVLPARGTTQPADEGSVPSRTSTPATGSAAASALATATSAPALVSVAATSPLPSASPTPSPSATAATNLPAAPAPARAAQTGVRLQAGANDITYTGAPLPAGQAFSALSGLYDVVYITAPGQSGQVVYRPGSGAGPVVPTGSWVRIMMRRAATVDLPAN